MNQDELTSCYSLHEDIMDHVDLDDTPYTEMRYRKSRPTGIPVILTPKDHGASFWKIKPNALVAAVVAAAQEKLLTHNLNKDGSLKASVVSLESANRLLSLTDIVGLAVTTKVPLSYSNNLGNISDVSTEYSDQDLLEYLKDTGVVTVRRRMHLPARTTVHTKPGRSGESFFSSVQTGRCLLVCFLDLSVIPSLSTWIPPYSASDVNVMGTMQKTAVNQIDVKLVQAPTTARLARLDFTPTVQVAEDRTRHRMAVA